MFNDYLVPGKGHPRAVMETVGVLHNMGYGLIRLYGSWESLNQHKLRTLKLWDPNLWRYAGWAYRIFPAHADKKLVITSTIPWLDHPVITGSTPEEAAGLLVENYPDIFEAGRGNDETYTSWYREMINITSPNGIADMWGDNGIFISDCPSVTTFTPFLHEELPISNRPRDERNESRLLMETIGELHKLGYGKVKLYCYFKEGLPAWRKALFADSALPPSMREIESPRFPNPLFLASNGDTPHDLANKLIEERANDLTYALGKDETYVSWYANMLRLTAPDGIMEMEYPNHVTFTNSPIRTLTPPIYR